MLEFLKNSPPATVEDLLNGWKNAPESFFIGQHNQPLEWHTCYGLAQLECLPESHGYSLMPNIKCEVARKSDQLVIGWIEGISMYAGGTVKIKHFALNTELTNRGIGVIFFGSIVRFFKRNKAITIEFHENHGSKIAHYRSFFSKLGIPEIRNKVWQMDLYKYTKIPLAVTNYQGTLANKTK